MTKEYPYIPPPYMGNVHTVTPDICRLRIGSTKGPLVKSYFHYIKNPLKLANLGNYPFLPLIELQKQQAEPLISPEERGSCLELTHNFKNSLAYVVLHTRNEQNILVRKGVEVKASKGVTSVSKGRTHAHNKQRNP